MSHAAHLKVTTLAGEVVIDEDVNDVEYSNGRLVWRVWEQGQKDDATETEMHDRDLERIELSRCSDRLVREPAGSSG